MKPIHLRFAGIHSYREAQEIDFAQLCDGHLFGIFGPTGSGKSTVLDAITLALYGKVERAPRNTQGILNHAEDSLFVAFTFELGTGERLRRFQVERRYRRQGENELRNAHSRLIEKAGNDSVVLADKDTQVTAAITEVLGLTHDDFTRAVVLPQGKFAQFLSLTPGDRRKMLQSIFALEQYGDHLAQKIRTRSDRAQLSLGEVEGEQTGLGDASPQALAAFKAQMESAATEMAQAQERLTSRRKAHAAAERKRELQAEFEGIEEALRVLEAAAPAIAAAKAELRAAEAAEPLRREIASLAQAEQALQSARKDLAALDIRLQVATRDDADAAAALQKARTARQVQAPRLIERRAGLQQAAADEARLQSLTAQQNDATAHRDRLQKELDQLQAEYERATNQRQAFEETLRRLREKIRSLQVPANERRRIQSAMAALERFEAADASRRRQEQQVAAARSAAERAATKANQAQHVAKQDADSLAEHEAALAQLEAAPPADDSALTTDLRFLEATRSQLREIGYHERSLMSEQKNFERESSSLTEADAQYETLQERLARAESERDAKRRELVEAQDALQRAEASDLAATLAGSLDPDHPCPVCGSTHHPSPVIAASGRREQALAAKEAAEAALAGVETTLDALRREATQVEARRQGLAQSVADGQRRLDTLGGQVATLRQALPAAWRDLDLPTLSTRLADQEAEYEARRKRMMAWQAQVKELRQQITLLRQTAAASSTAQNEAAAGLTVAQTTYQNAQAALAEATNAVQECRAAFQAVAGDVEAEIVRAQAAALDEAEHELEKAQQHEHRQQQQLDALAPVIDRKARQLESERAKLQELQSDIRNRAEQITGLRTAIHQITGGIPAAEGLAAVGHELQRLENEETACERRYDEAAGERRRLEQLRALSQQTVDTTSRRFNEASESLANTLAAAGFADLQQAEASLRDPTAITALQSRIDEHTQALSARRARGEELKAQIGPDPITDATWTALQAELEQAEARHRELVRAHGAAEQVFLEAQARRTRWEELEAKRVKLQGERDRLQQLAHLVRANRFVEFIAEEYLHTVALDASERLGALTRYRYALEIDSAQGFIIRDDGNGGIRRPVTSLSGGETFLTSLSLALALSNQIQLNGTHPLEFFFLDEGFGTLDPELLDTVMTSLERLQMERITIGLISHVPELRQRVPRRLIVEPATIGGDGSRLRLEHA